MSRGFLWGVCGAVLTIAVFLTGFGVGATVAQGYSNYYIKALQAKEMESPQMQCIHWVDQWKGVGPNPGPVFGMYTALCGRPDTAHQ